MQQDNRLSLNGSLNDLLQKVPPEKTDVFLQRLAQFVEEQGDQQSRIERLTADSARRQFFKAIYDRDYHLVKLLLTGSRRKYVDANLICPEDRWTSLHACLYKYNQYPPDDTLRIVRLLLDHYSDVNQPCPDGAVAINVLDKKPLPNGQQNGPDNPNREKKTVSFQNKMVLDVAIDFLQAYKWAGCRPTVLANWKPLIELLDEASITQKNTKQKEFNNKFVVKEPPTTLVNAGYQKKIKMLFEKQIGCDCKVIVIDQKSKNLDSKTLNNNPTKKTKIFPCHRAILMSSSPVFQAMFQNDMMEKKNSEIRIEDIPSEAVKLMLEYIYSGVLPKEIFVSNSKASNKLIKYHTKNNINIEHKSIDDEDEEDDIDDDDDNDDDEDGLEDEIEILDNNNKNNIKEVGIIITNNNNNNTDKHYHLLNIGCALLCLSDKYRMEDLKHHCEYQLHQLLNLDSCLPLLLSSNRYNAKRLRSVSLNYVSAHFQALSQSDKFKPFGDRNPLLLQEVLSNVTKQVQLRPQKRLKNAFNNNNQQNRNKNEPKY